VGDNVALIEALGAGLLCNDSRIVRNDEGQSVVQGDPTEAALIVAANKAGLSAGEISRRLPRIETIPFESEYRYMVTLHGADEAPKIIYIKGAVEALVGKCSHALGADGAPGLFSNPWLLVGIVVTWLAQLAFTYLPLLNRLFHAGPVRAEAWIYIAAIGVFTFGVVELEKWLRFRAPRPA